MDSTIDPKQWIKWQKQKIIIIILIIAYLVILFKVNTPSVEYHKQSLKSNDESNLDWVHSYKDGFIAHDFYDDVIYIMDKNLESIPIFDLNQKFVGHDRYFYIDTQEQWVYVYSTGVMYAVNMENPEQFKKYEFDFTWSGFIAVTSDSKFLITSFNEHIIVIYNLVDEEIHSSFDLTITNQEFGLCSCRIKEGKINSQQDGDKEHLFISSTYSANWYVMVQLSYDFILGQNLDVGYLISQLPIKREVNQLFASSGSNFLVATELSDLYWVSQKTDMFIIQLKTLQMEKYWGEIRIAFTDGSWTYIIDDNWFIYRVENQGSLVYYKGKLEETTGAILWMWVEGTDVKILTNDGMYEFNEDDIPTYLLVYAMIVCELSIMCIAFVHYSKSRDPRSNYGYNQTAIMRQENHEMFINFKSLQISDKTNELEKETIKGIQQRHRFITDEIFLSSVLLCITGVLAGIHALLSLMSLRYRKTLVLNGDLKNYSLYMLIVIILFYSFMIWYLVKLTGEYVRNLRKGDLYNVHGLDNRITHNIRRLNLIQQVSMVFIIYRILIGISNLSYLSRSFDKLITYVSIWLVSFVLALVFTTISLHSKRINEFADKIYNHVIKGNDILMQQVHPEIIKNSGFQMFEDYWFAKLRGLNNLEQLKIYLLDQNLDYQKIKTQFLNMVLFEQRWSVGIESKMEYDYAKKQGVRTGDELRRLMLNEGQSLDLVRSSLKGQEHVYITNPYTKAEN